MIPLTVHTISLTAKILPSRQLNAADIQALKQYIKKKGMPQKPKTTAKGQRATHSATEGEEQQRGETIKWIIGAHNTKQSCSETCTASSAGMPYGAMQHGATSSGLHFLGVMPHGPMGHQGMRQDVEQTFQCSTLLHFIGDNEKDGPRRFPF